MGLSKADLFNQDLNNVAELAKALAHPARIAIIQELIRQNSCICGDLVEVLPLSQATVSQHLKELKNVGLIEGDIDGQKVCYGINQEKFNELKSSFTEIFSESAISNKCC